MDASQGESVHTMIHEHPVYSPPFVNASWRGSDRLEIDLRSFDPKFPPSSMASGLSHIVFNDEFTIDEIDKEGRKFDRGETTSSNVLRDP